MRPRAGWLYLATVRSCSHAKPWVGNCPWHACPTGGLGIAQGNLAAQACTGIAVAFRSRQPVCKPGVPEFARSAQHRLQHEPKGNCWDNAVTERFFLNLKMERVWQRDYANHGEARRDITDYIVSFYNGIRLHSKLGYLSPAVFERKMTAIPPIPVSEIT